MKKLKNATPAFHFIGIIAILSVLSTGCTQEMTEDTPESTKDQVEAQEVVIWHVKAIHPEGRTLDVKALDREGNIHDVKAIQDADQRQLLDIKAFVGGDTLPVKMLVSDDEYIPVKAIGGDGAIYDIKALTPEGNRLDVKGTARSGNIVHLKAISGDGAFYGVKAISPEGELNDVKGIKMSEDNTETTVNGVQVHAHIKAIPQAQGAGDHPIWHIKAIHPEGRFLDVKALDKEGNIFDVKALRDADQRQIMDVKSLMNGERVPVKILVSDDKYLPVKAIGDDGTIYDVKALTPDGDRLDVKGVSRSGNVIHIKAINAQGDFYGVKAISPDGQLNDVKGLKMVNDETEATVRGVQVHAHIKAVPQVH